MLCKAKDKHDGSVVTGYYVKYTTGEEHILDTRSADVVDHEIEPGSVCRFTGLLVEGTMLWENDIVESDGWRGVVRFGLYNNKHYGFYISWENNTAWRQDINYWLQNESIWIVGNEKLQSI